MNPKSIFASVAALSLIAAAAPAMAAKTQSEQQPQATSGGKAERKICKTFNATESRMKAQRLCYTKAQWKKFEEAQQ